MHCAQLQLDYIKAWKKVSMSLQVCSRSFINSANVFMETRNASEQRLSCLNRTITWLELLQLCLKVYLRKGCSFSTHPCHPHRKYIPCLASNKTRQCVLEERYTVLQTEALIEDREQNYGTPLVFKCRLFTCDTFNYDEYTQHGSFWALNAHQFRLVL